MIARHPVVTRETGSATALILIDVINDLSFDGGDALVERGLDAARRLAALRERARRAEAPVIYVNDNFGRWRSDFRATVEQALSAESRGRHIVQLLRPDDGHYFVLKPRHSGFYATPLELLLRHLKVSRLILGGIQTHMCVLFTASDAHMREFKLWIPEDCSAAVTPGDHESALAIARDCFDADTRPSDRISVAGLAVARAGAP